MKVVNYEDFLNETFFSKIKKGKNAKSASVRVNDCVSKILSFLDENEIFDWNKFLSLSHTDRQIVDRIIDLNVNNLKELQEVRFRIKLELFDKKQLLDFKSELEENEEYEKCALVVKKLSQK